MPALARLSRSFMAFHLISPLSWPIHGCNKGSTPRNLPEILAIVQKLHWPRLRAQTKEPAWKQPESKAIQQPRGL